jgi:glutaredoxin
MVRHQISSLVSNGIACTFLVAVVGSTPAIAGSAEFGRCLTQRGAVFYGTSWCPHCRAQRRILGGAISYVRYVECSVRGDQEAQAPACTKAGIGAYPTWVFGDGSRAGGEQSLANLAARTGCKLSGTSESVERIDANGVRHRKVGGALIIDIPE